MELQRTRWIVDALGERPDHGDLPPEGGLLLIALDHGQPRHLETEDAPITDLDELWAHRTSSAS